jgi:hypothetical protein
MNRLLIAYWREWRPYIFGWTAAVVIFVLFAFFMEEYFDLFDHFR